MKVTSERLEDSQVRLHIEVEPERTAQSTDQAYRRLVNRVSIPGFRKGKAPRHVVERIVGADALRQEGIDLLLPQLFREAVAETGIQPIDEPHVDVVQQSPLIVDMTVVVKPTVEVGDYRDIRTERDRVSVHDHELANVIQNLRERNGEWLPVERAAQAGDRVTMDLEGHVRGAPVLYNPSGQAILETETGQPLVDQKGMEYRIELGSATPVKGFAEQLIGMRAGEEKRFELSFPPDHRERELASKSAIFHATVREIKEQRLPELDDEFAKTVGDYEDLEALRAAVRKNLEQRAEHEAQARLADRVVNMVADRARIELPAGLVEREQERLVARAEQRLRQANLGMDDFLRASKMDKDALKVEYRTEAVANLRRYLVLDEVAKAENITVGAEEIDAEIKSIAESIGPEGAKVASALNDPERRDELSHDIRHRKAIDRLIAIATGEETPAPQSETAAEGQASEA